MGRVVDPVRSRRQTEMKIRNGHAVGEIKRPEACQRRIQEIENEVTSSVYCLLNIDREQLRSPPQRWAP